MIHIVVGLGAAALFHILTNQPAKTAEPDSVSDDEWAEMADSMMWYTPPAPAGDSAQQNDPPVPGRVYH